MAAIAHVFTVGYVANLLGEDEDWLHELSTDMFPEDGCLWVYGVGETAFPPSPKTASRTCARSWSINEPPAAHRYRSNPPNSPALRCSPHGYLSKQDIWRRVDRVVREYPDVVPADLPDPYADLDYRSRGKAWADTYAAQERTRRRPKRFAA
jgi:hypothetical protein